MSGITSDNGNQRQTVEQLAEEFAERYRRGERPPLSEYVQRYPEHADEIRDLFPALIMMEKVASDSDNAIDPPAKQTRAASAETPRQLGDFRIIREIGHGGMGVVYEAEQVSLGRHVALKVLPHKLSNVKQKRRFEREARAAARLHHTNIVPVFGVGEHDGLPYYVMQFIQGLGLDEVLDELRRVHSDGGPSSVTGPAGELRVARRDAPGVNLADSLLTGEFEKGSSSDGDSDAREELPPNETIDTNASQAADLARSESGRLSDTFALSSGSVALAGPGPGAARTSARKRTYWNSVARIGVQVAAALDYAHKQGTLHRDVKPSNLLLDTRGTVWITDFGLAKMDDDQALTQTGDILGTLRYVPPEGFDGKSDARGDLYSLGLTLYELLALQPAFAEKDRNKLIKQVTTQAPTPLGRLNRDIPRDLQTVVHKAIERDPAHRYETAQDLAEDLQRFLDDEPVKARRVSRAEHLARWCRRNPLVAALTAALLLTLLCGLAGVTVKWREAEQQRERAESAQRDAENRRQQAEASQRNYQRTSARLMMEQGIGLCQQGRYGEGLLWLTSGLDEVPVEDVKLQQSFRSLIGGWGRRLSSQRAIIQLDASVESAAFSPDGVTLLIGCSDGAAWLWRAPPETFSLAPQKIAYAPVLGKPRSLAARHKGPVAAVAVSPDGQTLATGARDGTIELWTLTGQSLGKPMRHEGPIRVLAFSPNSKTLGSASNDGTARLWDVKTGRQAVEPLRHEREVRTLAFSPDGTMLVTGSDDATARIWDAVSGKRIGDVLRHGSSVRAVVFSPDSRLVLTGSNDRMARIWQAGTGKLQGEPFEHSQPIAAVAFGPDGELIAVACEDRKAYLWHARTGKAAAPPLPHPDEVIAVAFRPDGRTLLTGCADDGARLWDVATGRVVGEPMRAHGYLNVVAFGPDGRLVLTGGEDRTVRLWQTVRDSVRELGPADGAVLAAELSPDGQTVFVGSVKGKRYDRASGRLLGALHHSGHVIGSAAYSPDGKTIATGSFDSTVRLWDVETGKARGKPLVHLKPSFIEGVAFSPDGRTLLTASGNYKYEERRGEGQLWDVATGKLLARLEGHRREVTACAFAPDGKTVATASRDGTVRFWDASSGKPVGKSLKHERWVIALAFSPDGQFVVTGGSERKGARVWNVTTGEQMLAPLEHPDSVNAVAFSADGRLIATGCQDGNARFWDTASGRPVDVPVRHGGPVLTVSFSPDGRTLLTGSADRFARLVPVPSPCTAPSKWIRQWVRVSTTTHIDRSGDVSQLSFSDWQEQVRLLAEQRRP